MRRDETEEESELISKGPCDKCGSSDARCLYSDGHTYCFVCPPSDAFEPGDGEARPSTNPRSRVSADFIQGGEFKPLPARKLTEETCRKFGVRVGNTSDGKTVHLFPMYDPETREQIGQKARPKDKDGTFAMGKVTRSLFGQNLWSGGRKLVITEGEYDAMSVSQVQGHKWPVVSVPNGASNAAKVIGKVLDWVTSFEEVVLMFDMDAEGRAAAADCAMLIGPKAKIASLPHKDANECLQKGDTQAIISAIFNAQAYRPDGLIRISDVAEAAKAPPIPGVPWAWPTVTKWTFGRRAGELYGFGAGTGVGKTDLFTQQIEYDVNVLGLKVGLFYLEQNPVETVHRLAGKMKGKAFHVDDGSWTLEERAAAIDELAANDKVSLYQSFGHCEWDTIKAHIRFLAVADGVKHFYLDHLTALADPSNERESLEIIMTEMATMANELGLIFHYVSHLATPEGKSHEDGGRVLSKHFKGARAIAFWTHYMFGLERDKLAEDPAERCIATLRCIKDRMTGRADGETLRLKYDRVTCRLNEHHETVPGDIDNNPFSVEDDDEIPF